MDGNFNAHLAKPEGTTLVEEIVAALVVVGLENMSDHFLPRFKPW